MARTFAVQPMIPINPSLAGPPRASVPAAEPAVAAPSVARSHHAGRSARLPEPYRRYIILMLRSKQAQVPHPAGDAHGHMLDPIFKTLCAHAVVLLERIPPRRLRPVSPSYTGEKHWEERLLLTMVFRLILRIADDGGQLHHRSSYMKLLRAVVPVENPNLDILKFLLDAELLLLRDINYASYVTPAQLEATERRLDRWLSTKHVSLRRHAKRERETYGMAMLLADQLSHEANNMRPAMQARDRLCVPLSPESPGMPITPHGSAYFDLPSMPRLHDWARDNPSCFDLRPPPMPEEFLTQAAPYNLGATNGW